MNALDTELLSEFSGIVAGRLRTSFVLGLASGRTRYLFGLGARHGMTRRRAGLAYTIEQRSRLWSLLWWRTSSDHAHPPLDYQSKWREMAIAFSRPYLFSLG